MQVLICVKVTVGVGVKTCLPTGGHLMNVLITNTAMFVIISLLFQAFQFHGELE